MKIRELVKGWFNLVEKEIYDRLINDFNSAMVVQVQKEVDNENALNKIIRDLEGDLKIFKLRNKDLSEINYNLNKQIPKPIEFEETVIRYAWDNGSNNRLHRSLNMTESDKAYILQWLKDNNFTKLKPKDMEDMVFKAVNKLHQFTRNEYKRDMKENWFLPIDALKRLEYNMSHKTKKDFDCDDQRSLMYGVLIVLAEYFGYDIKGRLLAISHKQYSTKVYGHAVCAYLKDNGVWALLETSLHPDRFSADWVDDKDLFKSNYIDLWHIFDENTEYKVK